MSSQVVAKTVTSPLWVGRPFHPHHIHAHRLLDTITATLTSRSSLLLPCDSSTRVMELLVLLDQHWNYSRLRYPICFLSRNGREMLTFVRSMMEWLGGTISKEDVGEDGTNTRHSHGKRKRDDDVDEDALGALALRFKWVVFLLSRPLSITSLL